MKKRKAVSKVLSLILMFCMIITLLPAYVSADSGTGDTEMAKTEGNVQKVLDYAAQMRDKNQKENLSQGPFSWDTEKKEDTWRYFNGLMMDAFLMTGDETSRRFVEQFYEDNIKEDGSIPDYAEGELDSVEAARGLFDLLDDEVNSDKYEQAIQFVYSKLENQRIYGECGGNYLHKQETNGEPTSSWSTWNIGLDGLYMAQPFLMECANAIDEGKLSLKDEEEQEVLSQSIYKAVYNRFQWVAESMKDNTTGLYHHGWDVEEKKGNGHFWARGIGWYAMAQVDIIEMMPEGEYRTAMIGQLPTFFDAMLKYQDAGTGMWYNVVNQRTDLDKNILETSGSAMMAYALMKAYNNGYVTDEKYGEAGLNAFNGIVENKISGTKGNYTVADIYQKSGVASSDEDYCKQRYVDDEAKGTGALIMAATLANVTAAKLTETGEPSTEPTDPTDPTEPTTPTEPEEPEQPQEPSNTVDGYLQGEARYEEVTGEVESGEVYLIVNGNRALMNDHSKAASQNVVIHDNIAIASENADLCEWTFIEVKDGWTITNGSQSLKLDSSDSLISDGTVQPLTVERKNSDNTFRIYKRNGKSTYYLSGSDGMWSVARVGKTNSLYKKIPSQGAEVSFSVTPGSLTLKTGSTQQFTPSVLVNNAATGSYNITWESGNSQIAQIDENGLLTAVSDGTVNITATLTAANGIDMQKDLEIIIPVTVSSRSVTEAQLSGNTARYTKQNTEPNLSGIVLHVTYDDGSTAEVTTENGLVISGYDITHIGTYPAKITYLGKEYGTVLVVVEDNPYEGLDEAAEYPQYPDDGAVRIDKTAVGQDFNSTGVVQVELDTAGISVKSGVDVVLVVDVSNSMGWSTENAGGSNDAARLPSENQQDKLTDAMNAASSFAEILLGDNTEGDADNNTLSFVTFAGLDTDNAHTPQTTTTRKKGDRIPNKTTETYMDSVMTVFTGVTSAEEAKKSFDGTRFYQKDLAVNEDNEETGSVYYYLNIANTDGNTIVKGLNRGNTNYDYAFWQAEQAVNQLQKSYDDYSQSGRETVVVFMTDGAASHYNDQRSNGNAVDYLPGTHTTYPGTDKYPGYSSNDVKNTWYQYMLNYDNNYATELAESVSSFHAIGFDLAHGGFSNYQWTEDELTAVLKDMVKDQTLPVMAASDRATLNAFYESLAMQIKYAGTNAQVTDIIKSDFTLQMTGFGVDGNVMKPEITVTAYDLYTKADGVPENQIGTRTGESTPLETVTFNEDGRQAFSDKIGNSQNIMTISQDGSITITAQTFTYTKDTSGIERFVWKIGNITDQEVALSYYAYLKDSMEGNRAGGVYDTNENAVLEYVDINGDYATQTFPLPKVNWQGAITTIEYYLVDEKGHPVNENGVVIPFANRVVVGEGAIRTFNLNDSLTVNGAGYTPQGYEMYNPDASYTVAANSDGTGELIINDTKTITDSSEITTRRFDEDRENYTATAVAFAVIFRGKPQEKKPLQADQIVIDYGKAVQADVTANEDTSNETSYEVVGFMQYNPDTDITQTQFADGTKAFNGDYGQFTITEEGKVQYQLNRMLSAVERIFVVVKVTPNATESEAYRMLNELDVIPATAMYYEDDFANAITYTGTENTKWEIYSSNISDNPDNLQDDGTVGQNSPYGYDTSYNSDVAYSNASAHHIHASQSGDGGYDITYAQFTFTGTGFDLISITEQEAAMIRAEIYQGKTAEGEVYKSQQVANVGATNKLYQVPVLSCEDMPYGTYTVRVQVYKEYTNSLFPALNRGGHFVFDAVRIYDPIDVSGTALTGDAETAQEAYTADSEAYEQHLEIRDAIVSREDYDSTTEGTEIDGVLYIDATPGHATTGSDVAQVADYEAAGPNNEAYLKPGNMIGFILNVDQIPKTLQIGAKSVLGGKVVLDVSLENPDTEAAVFMSEIFSHATAQNYSTFVRYENDEDETGTEVSDLTPYFVETETGYQAYVYIANYGDAENQILSITDVKTTFAQPFDMSFGYSADVVNALIERLSSKEEAPAQPESEAQLISAGFTADSIRYTKQAELKVETTADVEDIVVLKENGSEQSATVKVETNDNGNKIWTLKFKPGKAGTYTYTVYGIDKNGAQTESAEVSIETTRR